VSELGLWIQFILRNESALGHKINLAFTSVCNEYYYVVADYETNLSSSDVIHNDSYVGRRYQARINYSTFVERARGHDERVSRSDVQQE